MKKFDCCKFCGSQAKLVKAHIVPEAFWKAMNKSSVPSKIISNDPTIHTKSTWNGIYDQNMICLACEQQFGNYDDYAISFFKDRVTQGNKIFTDGKLLAFSVATDYTKLKLFFISLLWRAHSSGHDFYQNVNLGAHAEILKNMLISQDPGTHHEYSVIVAKLDAEAEEIGIFRPWSAFIDGIKCYHFVFHEYHSIIKVASHRFGSDLNESVLRPNHPFNISILDYKKTKYWDLLKETVAKQKNNIFRIQEE